MPLDQVKGTLRV